MRANDAPRRKNDSSMNSLSAAAPLSSAIRISSLYHGKVRNHRCRSSIARWARLQRITGATVATSGTHDHAQTHLPPKRYFAHNEGSRSRALMASRATSKHGPSVPCLHEPVAP